MPKKTGKPSQTWMTFVRNHVGQMVSIDFFTVPTLQFRVLYVFIVLAHNRRRVLHFNVTEHPTATWTAQQIVEAFPNDTVPRYLVRDRDGIYGHDFATRVDGMGIQQVPITAPEPLAELLCGTDDRKHSPRMLGPCDRGQRVAFATNSKKLLQLLPSVENSSVVG